MELTIISGTWLFPYTEERDGGARGKYTQTKWIDLFKLREIILSTTLNNEPLALLRRGDSEPDIYLHGDNYARLIEDLEQIRAKQLNPKHLVIL